MVVTRDATIKNAQGFHMRPITAFVNKSREFDATIRVGYQGTTVDCSVISCIALAVPCGATITIEAEGPDAEAAADALVILIDNHFGMDQSG